MSTWAPTALFEFFLSRRNRWGLQRKCRRHIVQSFWWRLHCEPRWQSCSVDLLENSVIAESGVLHISSFIKLCFFISMCTNPKSNIYPLKSFSQFFMLWFITVIHFDYFIFKNLDVLYNFKISESVTTDSISIFFKVLNSLRITVKKFLKL